MKSSAKRRRLAGALLFLNLVLCCGCGSSQLNSEIVQQVREALRSDASETALLLDAVPSTVGMFVEQHSAALAEDVRSQVAALNAPAEPDQRPRVQKLRTDAQELASDLDRLSSPRSSRELTELHAEVTALVADISRA